MDLARRLAAFEHADLYVVITEAFCAGRTSLTVLDQVLAAGVKIVQLREKDLEDRPLFELALEYRRRIAESVARTRQSVLRDHLSDAAGQIDEWLSNLYQLAQRLDTYETDEVIRQDTRSVPRDIQTLQAKLKVEDDASVSQQMQQTIESKKAQLANLQQLENMMQKAELQMDGTLTAMGTIYSQLLLIGVKDIDSGRAQRLHEDITEQVKQIQDVVSSMDEVYHARA